MGNDLLATMSDSWQDELVIFALHSGGSKDSQQYALRTGDDYHDGGPQTSALSGVSRGLVTDTEAFVSSLDPRGYLDSDSRKVVLVEPIPMIQQHSAICEVMFEHKQQEAIYELPSGLAALIGMGRTSAIAVDVGTDLIQCQIFFDGYDIQQAVFSQPGSFKPQGSADFELPDGAIVPTMDLIRECKSSLPPGLMLKWSQEAVDAFKCNQEDATMGRIPDINQTLLTGLGLPDNDQHEEVLLWSSSLGTDNQKVRLFEEHKISAFMGGQIYSQYSAFVESSGFSKSDYEEQGANRTGSRYPACSLAGTGYQEDGSLAEFGNDYLVHGQAASDWVNREPGQWIKDVYVELERLDKLSPKDVVKSTSAEFKLAWEDFTGEWEGEKYEDLDEEDKNATKRKPEITSG